MKKWTIEYLRENNLIAYEYIRGSHAYGTNVETSDEDHGGVFICPPDMLLGLRSEYIEQVADETNDTVFYEFGRWVELLLKANPTALESLYIPDDCIIGKIHPMVQHIIDNRDMFLSKECFKTLTGYAVGQIHKARGLNKKIVNPVEERKGVLDFCYVPYNQGAKKIKDWLADYGMKQKYCGLVALPNMHDNYGVYYDWATHFISEFGVDLRNLDSINEMGDKILDYNSSTYESYEKLRLGMDKFLNAFDHLRGAWYYFQEELYNSTPYGFRGIVNDNSDSNDVRVCTVPKNLKPITYMSYNKTGYTSHCKDYFEYTEWKKNRNPVRYENNLGHNYDSKNLCHTMRLARMGKELALGQGFNVRRKDRDFLLSIRNHEMDYDTIIAMAEKEKEEMEAAIPNCGLPDKVDYEKVNELLTEARKKFYNVKIF